MFANTDTTTLTSAAASTSAPALKVVKTRDHVIIARKGQLTRNVRQGDLEACAEILFSTWEECKKEGNWERLWSLMDYASIAERHRPIWEHLSGMFDTREEEDAMERELLTRGWLKPIETPPPPPAAVDDSNTNGPKDDASAMTHVVVEIMVEEEPIGGRKPQSEIQIKGALHEANNQRFRLKRKVEAIEANYRWWERHFRTWRQFLGTRKKRPRGHFSL